MINNFILLNIFLYLIELVKIEFILYDILVKLR